MLLRSPVWYDRLEHKRRMEAVPLNIQLSWCRLRAPLDATTQGRQRTTARTILLGITLFLILCTPMVLSSNKMKLRPKNTKYKQETLEYSMVSGENDVGEADGRDRHAGFKASPVSGREKFNTFNMSSSQEYVLEVIRSKSLLNLPLELESMDALVSHFEPGVDVYKASGNLDVLAGEATINHQTNSRSREPRPRHDAHTKTSLRSRRQEKRRISNQKKGVNFGSDPTRSHKNQGHADCYPSLDSSKPAEDQTVLDSVHVVVKTAIKLKGNEIGAKAMAVAIALLCFSLHLYREGSWQAIAGDLWFAWRKAEGVLSAQGNLATLAKQMVFLSVCAKILMPGQHLSSLYTLMFCSIVTYCVEYAAELLTRQQWCLSVRIGSPRSSIRHLALSTTNMVLEWTKAVTFITTVVFMLLMLGLEKGLENYSPSPLYILIAALYWLSTEKVCRNAVLDWTMDQRWRCCDSLDELYVPLFLQYFQLFLLVVFTAPCFLMGHYKHAIIGATFVRMDYLHARRLSLKLSGQLSQLGNFRSASESELTNINDRCSICLSWMTSARVTQCHHFYHAQCLLNILNSSPKCPMCQANLVKTIDDLP